jgi:hypothetical protein
MALTSQQLEYLRTTPQRYAGHVGQFPVYTITVTAPNVPDAGIQLTPTPIPVIEPRYSIVDHSESITLYGTNTKNRDGSYVGNGNVSFSLADGDGSVNNNGDGTATYTGPASGNGVATVQMDATNGNGTKTGYAYVYYGTDIYDNVVTEIVSLSGSLDQRGWSMLLRCKGTVTSLTRGVGVLVHIEDTWNTTTATFGGYRYAEGVCFGYITARQGYYDGSGEYWTGIEIKSPWWLLERCRVGETFWSIAQQGGFFYIDSWAPVDAIWHLLNEVTDFTEHHNVTLWNDGNTIDSLKVQASDLATIVADIMARTLSIAYCDRYGNLMCVPDPDVRADEFWGTPSPVYTGAESLDGTLVLGRTIRENDYQVQRLTLEAYDSSRMGIFAISENATAPGNEQTIGGLLCDQATRLAGWAVQKRAQLNRAWSVQVDLPLNHTVDICNFVDVNFTAVSQVGAPTASGRTWVSQVSYRPDIYRGTWQGGWTLNKVTEGDGEAETGAASGWGGSGQYYSGNARYTGSARGDWATGGSTALWCQSFDFEQPQSGWLVEDYYAPVEAMGSYVAAVGFQDTNIDVDTGSGVVYLDQLGIYFDFGQSVSLTNVTISAKFLTGAGNYGISFRTGKFYSADDNRFALFQGIGSGTAAYEWSGVQTAQILSIDCASDLDDEITLNWLQVKGYLPNPFGGTGNCSA